MQGSSDRSILTERGRQQAAEVARAVFVGGDDATITPTGILLRLHTFDQVYVSPLQRAVDTWSIIHDEVFRQQQHIQQQSSTEINTLSSSIATTAILWNELRELDLYDWEGRSTAELECEYPAAYRAWVEGDAQAFTVSYSSTSESASAETSATSTSIHQPIVEMWQRARKVWEQLRSDEITPIPELQPNGPKNSVSCRRRVLLVCHGTFGQALLCTAMGWDETYFRKVINHYPNCGLLEVMWPVHAAHAQQWQWIYPPPPPSLDRAQGAAAAAVEKAQEAA